ncbi:MAG: hypothetical protein RLY21_1651 [Planctomycetota bacterium]|jgi:hypothetical protein
MKISIAHLLCTTSLAAIAASSASGQWVNFENQTASRLVAASSLLVNDNLEKDFAWGDFDQDGDMDLVCMRKFPGSIQGGFRDILFMNENGVLVDRTTEYGSAADAAGSQGMLDAANDRDVKAFDVDNDGWLDLVTATTMSDHVSTMLGQPRVYRNLGNNASGQWQGFRFEDARIPQLFAANGSVANPRFCDMAIGDFTGDGYVDIFYTDYDTPETSGTICIDLNADGDTADAGECQQSPGETASNDFQNKFLVNLGASNPGHFTDTTTTRMTSAQLSSAFGNAALAADLNGDSKLDIVRVNTLTGGQDVASIYSRTDGLGESFLGPDSVVGGAPYNIDQGDLNSDGKVDLIVVDDGQDKVLINSGNGADGFANFTSYTITDSLSEFGNTARVADLNNDGRVDVIICDVDADLGPFCPNSGRRTKIYYNTGTVGSLLLDEQGTVLPVANLSSVFDIATLDINGDGWLDLVVGRCGGIEVFINKPPFYITFSYPSGRPSVLNPAGTNSFSVRTSIVGGGTIVAGTEKLFVSTDAGATYTGYPLVQTTPNNYLATFPPVQCGQSVRYYLAANLSNGGLNTDPSTAPTVGHTASVVTSQQVAFSDSFEGVTSSWGVTNDATLTAGGWVAGTPIGTISGSNQSSPSSDATPGSGVRAFVTGLGVAGGTASSQDVDGGPTTLTSPVFDLSDAASASLTVSLWFFCDDIASGTTSQADAFRVEVSNGGAWVLMEDIRTNLNTSWSPRTYAIESFVPLTSTVRVRFVTADVGNNSTTEAGVDEFTLTKFLCEAPPCPADVNGDGSVDSSDLAALLGSWGGAKNDIDGDGVVGSSDLAAVLSSWGACP